MRYEFKKYSKDEFLIVQDPYTGTNLAAVNISKFEEKELMALHLLTFFKYYDFTDALEYRVFVVLNKKDKKHYKEHSDYLVDCYFKCLDIPETQASQLALLTLSKDRVQVKATKSFKEAFSTAHNLIAAGLDVDLKLKRLY